MRSTRSAVVLLLALCLPAVHAHAGSPVLVGDLDPGVAYDDSSPQPEELRVFRGEAVFTVLETNRGRTLWASDGTPDGTRRLAEGLDAVTAILGEAAGGLVVFAAPGFQQPRPGLWRVSLDGRAERLLPSGVGVLGRTFFPWNGAHYFFATPAPARAKYYFPPSPTSLWSTDGTAAGTREVAPVGASHFTVGPVAFEGRLFFLVAERGEDEPEVYMKLWSSDGRSAGTVKVADLETESNQIFLVPAGRRLAFPARAHRGEELWGTDGTTDGTFPLTDFRSASPFLDMVGAVAAGGRLYFAADDGVHGRELWTSDGTARGTVRLTSFAAEDPFSTNAGLVLQAAGPGVLFVANDGEHGREVWRSAGTAQTTALVADVCPGSCAGFYWPGPVMDGKLYFTGFREDTGTEPWASDGTAPGTQVLVHLCPGTCETAAGFALVGEEVAILDFEQGASFSLHSTDGTAAGTDLLLEADLSLMLNSFRPFAKLGRRLVFFASSPEDRAELWVAAVPRGTAAPVTDITQDDPAGSDPVALTAAGGKVYFVGCDDTRTLLYTTTGDGATPLLDFQNDCVNFFNSYGNDRLLAEVDGRIFLAYLDLWTSDGTPEGTVNLTNFDWRPTSFPMVISNVVELDGRAAFLVIEGIEEGLYKEQLWLSDGTPEGTQTTHALPQPLTVFELFSIGDRLYFWATDAEGTGLWSSDGTAAGTHLLHRLPAFSGPSEGPPVAALGAVYFAVHGLDFSLGLWRTDGTPEGTEEVALRPQLLFGSPAEGLTAMGGALYFLAAVGQGGERELWRTNGTPEGTARLGPLGLGAFDEVVGPVVAGGKLLLLAASFDTSRLWTSDGTVEGTHPVGPVLGSFNTVGAELVAAGDRVFLSVNDEEHGRELWTSDGTDGGTRLAADIAPGSTWSEPGDLTVAGTDLYFVADDGTFGREPWRLPVGPGAGDCTPSPFSLCLAGGRLQATLAWRDAGGVLHRAAARPLAGQSGGFSFTEPASLEVVVKALDARAINGHLWAFAGPLTDAAWELTWRDGATGGARRWVNLLHQQAPAADLEAFPAQGPPAAAGATRVLEEGAPRFAGRAVPALAPTLTPAPACSPAPGVLCLHGGRFRVEVSHGGSPLGATVLPWSDLVGAFALAPGVNADLAVKVLDATALDGHFWLFGTALTSRAYTVTVTDTVTGAQKAYDKPEGELKGFVDLGTF